MCSTAECGRGREKKKKRTTQPCFSFINNLHWVLGHLRDSIKKANRARKINTYLHSCDWASRVTQPGTSLRRLPPLIKVGVIQCGPLTQQAGRPNAATPTVNDSLAHPQRHLQRPVSDSPIERASERKRRERTNERTDE